jgi:hypothetical protein
MCRNANYSAEWIRRYRAAVELAREIKVAMLTIVQNGLEGNTLLANRNNSNQVAMLTIVQNGLEVDHYRNRYAHYKVAMLTIVQNGLEAYLVELGL